MSKANSLYRSDNGILLKLPRNKSYELLGEISSLLLSSKLHRQYRINDIGTVFLPPIHLNQFRIYKNKDVDPIALVTWAFFSKEIKEKYLTKKYLLKPEDWKSGDRLWLIDFLAPFGHMKMVGKDLKNNVFPDAHGRSVRITDTGEIKGIYNWYGINYQNNKKKINKDK
ncbi:MAG: toxin-activating lysine-acyltransferase [Rickettsiales bacterium]